MTTLFGIEALEEISEVLIKLLELSAVALEKLQMSAKSFGIIKPSDIISRLEAVIAMTAVITMDTRAMERKDTKTTTIGSSTADYKNRARHMIAQI